MMYFHIYFRVFIARIVGQQAKSEMIFLEKIIWFQVCTKRGCWAVHVVPYFYFLPEFLPPQLPVSMLKPEGIFQMISRVLETWVLSGRTLDVFDQDSTVLIVRIVCEQARTRVDFFIDFQWKYVLSCVWIVPARNHTQ